MTVVPGGNSLPRWLAPLVSSRPRPALEHVLADPAADHSVESLARDAHMSRSAFTTTFLHVVGETPMTFVRRVRMRRAAAALLGSDLSVASVARAVGFSSRSHFSQAFTAAYGASPSDYRRQPSGGTAHADEVIPARPSRPSAVLAGRRPR